MSRYYRKRFCVPTVHPTPSTSPTIEAQINKHLILNICVIDTSFSCRACRGCRVHCRDTKTFPVVPRHGLVSYRGVPVSMVRHKKLLKAPKCLISLITVFFGTPCILSIGLERLGAGETVFRDKSQFTADKLRCTAFYGDLRRWFTAIYGNLEAKLSTGCFFFTCPP